MSSFFGLNLGLKGLQAQQKAMDITGHNIANANTPGYSRQNAVLTASVPINQYPAGQIGTGVNVASIQRMRDNFLDNQMRYALADKGTWEARADVLHNLEAILNEPMGSAIGEQNQGGINAMMRKFWDTWHGVTNNPESSSARISLRETTATFTRTVRETYSQIEALASEVETSLKVKVKGVNDILQKLYDINKQVQDAVVSGQQPNDLLDQRDLLLEEVSKLVNNQANILPDGQVEVFLNGKQLLSKNNINVLKVSIDTSGVYFSTDDQQIQVSKGEIYGLVSMHQELKVKYLANLDTFAVKFTEEVNAIHASGYNLNSPPGNTGVNFFKPVTSAKDFDLDDAIYTNVANIAASGVLNGLGETSVGDSSNSIAISQLRHKMVLSNGTATLENYYKDMLTYLGVSTQESYRMVDNQDSIIYQIEQRRENIQGVSLDEEMTNLVQFQRAYQASARIISTMDEMLDTIINRMGR